ncbi:MAG: hypothetical protein ABIN36_14360 [Ferruginibacter sp.]
MIFVFKTSVKNRLQIKNLKQHIEKIIPDAKWNFDLEDREKILRIDSEENIVLAIRNLLNDHNLSCEELE